MATVEVKQVIIFRVPEEDFWAIIKPLTPRERDEIHDCPVIDTNSTLIERRCYGAKEAIRTIVPRQLLKSFHPRVGLQVTIEEADFMRLVQKNFNYNYYLAALGKRKISETGILRGGNLPFDFVGRNIVGTKKTIRKLLPQLQLIHSTA